MRLNSIKHTKVFITDIESKKPAGDSRLSKPMIEFAINYHKRETESENVLNTKIYLIK